MWSVITIEAELNFHHQNWIESPKEQNLFEKYYKSLLSLLINLMHPYCIMGINMIIIIIIIITHTNIKFWSINNKNEHIEVLITV